MSVTIPFDTAYAGNITNKKCKNLLLRSQWGSMLVNINKAEFIYVRESKDDKNKIHICVHFGREDEIFVGEYKSWEEANAARDSLFKEIESALNARVIYPSKP